MIDREIRVLLLEDDEDDYVLTRDLLRDSRRTTYHLDWFSNCDDALRAIRAGVHDVYLLDYRLGERDGIEILREGRRLQPSRPFILLTGQGDAEIDIAAMKAGAADYLIKGSIDAHTLDRTVRYTLEQSRMTAALRESEERYALSARGANDGLWVWDLADDTVYYSPRWKEMLGYSEEEIGTRVDEWFSRVHPDDLTLLREAIRLHTDGSTSHLESEYRMAAADGSWRWMLVRGMAVFDDNGASRIAGSQTDITERKRAVERLTHDAFHDSLTQLPNRALFMDRLGHAIGSAKRHPSHRFAVLFLDLDRFKVVNDSLGHVAGDAVLVSVAERLHRAVRPGDTVARFGGDEFTILLDGIEQVADAVRAATRIQEELSVPLQAGTHEVVLSASIGISVSLTGYDRPEEILRDADIAMYRAKSSGKARHELFDKQMHEEAVALLQLESELRHALAREELVLHYQPIVHLGSNAVVAFEALLRWQRGATLVSADTIIPLAEETGLIVPMGRWVLRAALEQLASWERQGLPLSTMHVNLSARQFLDPGLVEHVAETLQETGIDPDRLHLEITETVLISNPDGARRMLDALRALGVHIALDDFGIGYSSLATLQRFPFDILKIDRSFLRGDPVRNDAIIATIAALGSVLGMDCTVEGVETPEQAERVRRLGIGYAQGFLYSPAVDGVSAGEMLVRAIGAEC